MARSEITFQIKMEPTEETMLWSKKLLEMWLNAAPGRVARVTEKYNKDDELVTYLEIFDVNTGQEWGLNEPQTETS